MKTYRRWRGVALWDSDMSRREGELRYEIQKVRPKLCVFLLLISVLVLGEWKGGGGE